MAQRVSTAQSVDAVSLTPLARVVRTVVQIVLAVGGSIPIILAATNLSGAQITKVEAIVAGLTATVSAVQNVLENLGAIPVAGGFVGSLAQHRYQHSAGAASIPKDFAERT